jgi:lysozyme family protein
MIDTTKPSRGGSRVLTPSEVTTLFGTVTPTESNPFGGTQCPSNQLITDNMKNGDTNGVYSSYNQGTVTQVSILQAHINRILGNEYTQAAGPVDNYFRSKTKLGVERLQTKLNQLLPTMKPLVIDGIVGTYTKKAINMSC